MAGLINIKQEQPQDQEAVEPRGGQEQGSPDKVAVERVVVAAVKVIHDPQIRQQLVQMMKQAGDPVQALVEAVFLVMRQLFEKSKRSIPEDVLGAASVQVLVLLGELAQAAGLFQVTPELLQQAAQAGLARLEQEEAAKQRAPAQPAAPAPEQPMTEGV